MAQVGQNCSRNRLSRPRGCLPRDRSPSMGHARPGGALLRARASRSPGVERWLRVTSPWRASRRPRSRASSPRLRRPRSAAGSPTSHSRPIATCWSADIEQGKWKALDDAFYAVLEFGTGGRRGKMYPVGTNVLNERTMAESARGLADYVARTKGPRRWRNRASSRATPDTIPPSSPPCAAPRARRGRLQGLSLPPSRARPPCSPPPSGT